MKTLKNLSWSRRNRHGVFAEAIHVNVRRDVLTAIEESVEISGVLNIHLAVADSGYMVWTYLEKKKTLQQYCTYLPREKESGHESTRSSS